MKRFIALALISISIGQSCHKTVRGCGTLVDVDVNIHYVDNAGKDLFPNTAKGYIQDSVRLYVMQNGVKTVVFVNPSGATLTNPYNYLFYNNGSSNYTRIFTNNNVINDTATTFIDLSKNIEDTIKCSYIRVNEPDCNSISIDKVWYNGKLMSSREFTIVH